MEFKTHIALGLLIAIGYTTIFHNVNPYIFFPVALLFSIVPDIDHSKSFISRKFPVLSSPIHFFFKHRGFIHSIFPALFLFLLFYYLHFPNLAFGMFIGYTAHLIGDGFTKQGINFLHPFSTLEIHGPIETGSFSEFMIFILLIAINGFIIIGRI